MFELADALAAQLIAGFHRASNPLSRDAASSTAERLVAELEVSLGE